jgi:hypothetical protein
MPWNQIHQPASFTESSAVRLSYPVEYFDDVESASPKVQYGQYFDLLADPFEINNRYQDKINKNSGEVAKMR